MNPSSANIRIPEFKVFRQTLDENGQKILMDVNDEDLPGFKKFYTDSHKFALLLPDAFASILHIALSELHGKVPGIVKRTANLIPEVTKILAEKYPNIVIEHKNAGDFKFWDTPRGKTEDERKTDSCVVIRHSLVVEIDRVYRSDAVIDGVHRTNVLAIALATLFHELAHYLLTQTAPELPHTPPLKQLAYQYSHKPKKMGEIGCKLELVLFEGVITGKWNQKQFIGDVSRMDSLELLTIEVSKTKQKRTVLYRRLEQSHLLPLVSNLDSIAEGRTPDDISVPFITISGNGDKIPVTFRSVDKAFRMRLVECESSSSSPLPSPSFTPSSLPPLSLPCPSSSLSCPSSPVTSSESSSSSEDEDSLLSDDGDLSLDDDDLDSSAGFRGPLLRNCVIMDGDDVLSN